ncbi:MAG: sulfatase [Geodermatophilaceae bacterium]|nr:sulfatase [Geodermatophilaceae bacterium]
MSGVAAEVGGERRRTRVVAARGVSVLAVLLVWLALVFPAQPARLSVGAFLRIPAEGLLIVALGLALPARAGRIMAAIVGLVLGLLAILKVLDLGFLSVLGRRFNPVSDWGYLRSGADVLRDSIGPDRAAAAIAGAVLLLVAVLVAVTASVLRLTRFTARHRASSAWAVTAVGVVWSMCAVLGVQVGGAPVASTTASVFVHDQVDEVLAADDPFANTPGQDLLTGLRGKDVIVAFVESYGRAAVQDSPFSPQVNAVLNASTHTLRADGFSSRSAFLTSPTLGGISWLAHSTLQSGRWIDTQQRYDQLVATDRLTLSGAFKRAGWRTVGDLPANTEDWPEGTSFYHYDTIYDSRNVGYAGPSFSYASMPDQYVLSAFEQRELATPNHAPVMAEIDLVSSHGPWAPLPHLVGWNEIGDGSVFDNMAAQGHSPDTIWGNPDQVKAAYAQSIQYSLSTLISFVHTFGDDNLVLILVGDHQPATIVSGQGASRDVPITIIARDPKVLDRISAWGWQEGMLPSPQAPVWPMDRFRDRFLTAYGPQPATQPPTASPSPR